MCESWNMRSGLFYSQLNNRELFMACTVHGVMMEVCVSVFLDMKELDTIYEYLSGTNQTRTNFEQVSESQTQELNIKPGPGVHRYEQVVVSHNNPFGGPYSYDSQEMLAGHRNILYIFGHVSHETMTRNDRKESGCTFLDIDTSPKSVTVIALDDYLKN